VSRLDQSCGNIIGTFDGSFVLHFNDVVGYELGGESCADKYGVRQFTITCSNDQPSSPVAFKFINIQFLGQTTPVNNPDSMGQRDPSPRIWLDIKTVMSCSRISSSSNSRISIIPAGANPFAGSSRMSNSGWCIKDLASSKRGHCHVMAHQHAGQHKRS